MSRRDSYSGGSTIVFPGWGAEHDDSTTQAVERVAARQAADEAALHLVIARAVKLWSDVAEVSQLARCKDISLKDARIKFDSLSVMDTAEDLRKSFAEFGLNRYGEFSQDMLYFRWLNAQLDSPGPNFFYGFPRLGF